MPKKFLVFFLLLFLIILGFLFFNFKKTKKVKAMATGSMVASMKTLASDNINTLYDDTGYFYVPIFRPEILEVVFLFNDAGLEGDQSGPTIGVPDGQVNKIDLDFIASNFGFFEGELGWEYMADVNADKIVEGSDLGFPNINFDNTGTYIDSFVATIEFRDDVGIIDTLGLDSDNMVLIPSDADNFTVKFGGILPIGAYVKFYTTPPPNVFGWAWSENAGWISFNKLNCDPNGNGDPNDDWSPGHPCIDPDRDYLSNPIPAYGKYIHSFTGIVNILGQAWSSSLGWLDFNPTADPPPIYPPYTAQLDNDTGKVLGWARFLSHGGSWDGWVKLSSTFVTSTQLADDPTEEARDEFKADTAGGSGLFLSLELVPPEFPEDKDKPLVSHSRANSKNLRTAFCDSRFCTLASDPDSGNTGDTAGDQGYTTSLALDKYRNPVISFVELVEVSPSVWDGYLKVRRCDDPKCTGTGTGTGDWENRLDTENDRAYTTSLELDFFSPECEIAGENLGCPMVAYGVPSCDPPQTCTQGTYFIHCDDPFCDGDENPNRVLLIDTLPAVDRGIDIEIDKNGNPVIIAQPSLSNSIKIFHCDDVYCNTFNEGTNVPYDLPFDAFGLLGWLDAELDFFPLDCRTLGCPAIFAVAPGALGDNRGFIRCHLPDCSENSGWKTGFEPEPYNLSYASLEITSGGYPVMIYRDSEDEELVLIRCTNLDCNNFTRKVLDYVTPAQKAAGDYTGRYADLELDSEDLPFIAYRAKKAGLERLWFITCRNPGCTDTVIPYGVTYNSTTKEFSGWAFGSDVTGWASFNCKDRKICDISTADVICDFPLDCFPYGTLSCVPQRSDGKTACDISDYKVKVSQAPSAIGSVDPPNSNDYCEYLGKPNFPPVRVRWQYSDPDDVPSGTDPQSAYQIQVYEEVSGSLVVDTGYISDSCINNCDSYVFQSGELAWNTSYTWRVKVWDSHGMESPWASGPPIPTISHAWPSPDFTPSPSTPAVKEVVKFTDSSVCWDATLTSYNCQSGGVNISYEWDFDYISPSFTVDSIQKGDETNSYSIAGSYTVGLRITDSSLTPSGVCTTYRSLTVTLPFPEWKEIPPF